MSQQVVELETIPVHLPRNSGWSSGVLRAALEERLLVRIRTEDGTEGWGEATALPRWGGIAGRHYGETVQTATHVIHDLLAPSVFEADVRAPDLIHDAFDRNVRGHPYARAAVEMALQDIRGKLLGEPLYRLLGGPAQPRIRIAHMIGVGPEEAALPEAEQAVSEDGITALQVKGGRDVERDVSVVRALRAALPAGLFLRLDANQAYGNDPKAVARIAHRLEDAGIDAIEQPGSSDEVLEACRAAVSVPIIADESCWTARDVLELWRRGAADAVSVYVAKAAGMERAVLAARTAATVGMRCDVNGSMESGVGTAASVHVAMACANATLASILTVPSRAGSPVTHRAGRYWDDDIVLAGFVYEAGFLSVREAPGLAITVDRERVEALASGGRRLSRAPV